jgi:uncharacterized membrane protein
MAEFYSSGRHVPAGHGWKWIVEGWALFMRAPGLWIVIAAIYLVIWLAVISVPGLGALVSPVLCTLFAGGLALGCRTLDEGGEFKIEQLFAGFQQRPGTLIAAGLLYLAALFTITLVCALVVGFKVYAIVSAAPVGGEALVELVLLGALAMLVWVVLALPVVMAIWFAPALVVFRHLGALQAMKASFVGCLRNFVPLVVYGLVLLVPAVIATLPAALGWLILGPLVVASTYAAYKDIYTG